MFIEIKQPPQKQINLMLRLYSLEKRRVILIEILCYTETNDQAFKLMNNSPSIWMIAQGNFYYQGMLQIQMNK